MAEPGLEAKRRYAESGETDMSGKYWARGSIRRYFEQYTQFEGKSVLDFGCGRGNFISFQPHGNYTGVEIDEDICNQNKFNFPQYKWELYDGYNYMYNSKGKEHLPKMFTHFTFEETKPIIDVLKSHCDQVLLTYYSNRDKETYEAICKWRNLEPNMWDQISNHDVFYLKTEKPEQWLWSFYNDDWLAEHLGGTWHDTKFPRNTMRGLHRCLVI